MMLEVWVCKEEPSVRLVVPAGGRVPAELGHRDWTLAGPLQGDAKLVQEVNEKGYCFLNSAHAAEPASGLKDASPAGSQEFDFR